MKGTHRQIVTTTEKTTLTNKITGFILSSSTSHFQTLKRALKTHVETLYSREN